LLLVLYIGLAENIDHQLVLLFEMLHHRLYFFLGFDVNLVLEFPILPSPARDRLLAGLLFRFPPLACYLGAPLGTGFPASLIATARHP
jgi:hypothetical protein